MTDFLSIFKKKKSIKKKGEEKLQGILLLGSAGQNVVSLLSLPNPSLKDWTKRGNYRHPILSGLDNHALFRDDSDLVTQQCILDLSMLNSTKT